MSELREIDIELIDDPKRDIRGGVKNSEVEDLAMSIENVGLIQPIVVFRKEKRYEVIVGHRRLSACRVAGLEKVPAIVREVKPEEVDIIKLDENIFREEVSPVKIGEYIYAIMMEKGLTVMAMARYFGKTPQWVNSMLRLVDLDEYTRKAIDQGEISYASALEIQKIENETTRKVLTEAAVEGGAHTRTVKRWVQDSKAEARRLERGEEEGEETPEDQEEKVYKQRCMLCGDLVEVEHLVTVQVEAQCYPLLQKMCKAYQEAGK